MGFDGVATEGSAFKEWDGSRVPEWWEIHPYNPLHQATMALRSWHSRSRAESGKGQEAIGKRFHIISRLSSGCTASVIQARDRLRNHEPVAVKIFSPGEREVGMQEADAMARCMGSEGVVRFIGAYAHEGGVAIVMEHLGEGAFDRLRRQETSKQRRKAEKLCFQLCSTVAWVHSCGYAHLDLKPENVLARNADPESVPIRLIDFGNSLPLRSLRLLAGDPAIQSLPYRAPEVLFGCGVSAKADSWSLGCLLAEACMGKRLFMPASPVDLVRQMIVVLGGLPPSDPFSQGCSSLPTLSSRMRER